MTRITHFKQQPVNIQYWDYYILCRLNTDATIALQRMEYWDGTKEDGNIHSETINDALELQGQPATQDISNWVYKAQDELQWELMGVAGEKKLPRLINFLMKTVQYLEMRNNPANTWDRKLQYGFKAKTIQNHINYLGYIVGYFDLPLRRLTPVFYAIEKLTKEEIYIETINVDMVLAKITSFQGDEKIPHFLKMEIEKFFQAFQKPAIRPFRTFAEWKTHSCGMHPAKVRNGKRTTAESIPQKRGSNSIEFKTENTNREYKEDTYVAAHADDAPTPFFLTLSEGTPLLDHFTLAHPLTIQIEQTSEGYLISEPTYANHTVASTQDEALTAFKRSLVEEMHLLSQDESHLGKHLAEELAFLRGHIREEVTQAETIQPANGVEIPHPERENSSFSEATQPLAPNTNPTTTPSPEFDSQREREALAQQKQQQANAKSEASNLRIAEETTNTSSSGESAREQKPAEYPAPSKPRSRRTKKEVDSTEVTARVTHVYAYFDTLAQEITGVTDYHYNPNTKSADAIKAWLKTNPTEELLHEVFLELWNSSPDPRTGFTWKNNMRIPSILKEYDNRVLAIKARRSKKHVNHLVTAATNLGGHTLKPEDFDDDEVVYQTKQQRKRA